jgi:Tol biopolymer transport system component
MPENGGVPKQLSLGASADRCPRISRDAKRLVYLNESSTQNLWTIDLQTKELKQLKFEDANFMKVIYSSDGNKLIYWLVNVSESSPNRFVICNKDGSGTAKFAPKIEPYTPLAPVICWSADMKSVFFSGYRSDTIRKNPDSIALKYSLFEYKLANDLTREIGDGAIIDISRDEKYLWYSPDLNYPFKAYLALKSTPNKIIMEISMRERSPRFSWDSKSAIAQDSIGLWYIPLNAYNNKHLIKTPKSFEFGSFMPDDQSILGDVKDPNSQDRTLVKLYYASGRVEKICKMPGWGNYEISPDGKTLIYVKDETKNRIIVLDNFR